MKYINDIRNRLKLDESFDLIERHIIIGSKETYLYYIDGFIKDDVMERIMTSFFSITKEEMSRFNDATKFIDCKIPYVEVATESDVDKVIPLILSGQTAMIVEGFKDIILIDLRTYPVRGIGEPEKEKTLRGARDGFVETIVFNTALIRRRIRDERLVFKMTNIGSSSKSDVVLAYMDGVVDEKALESIERQLKNLKVNALSMCEESLVEALQKSHWLNPFPKVRFTERPDVASAHILEGKIAVIVDNSPSAMLLPTCIFDFFQDVDDYYMPVVTGNYLRFLRNLIVISTFLVTPLYLLISLGKVPLPVSLQFLLPTDPYAIPIFIQFLLLEFAIDGLKLASLNTPSSLGMSLSVIGGLILGEFAVKTGWFIPQTILYMAIVALASFTQPSIELSYSIKFFRMILLILVNFFGLYGLIGGLLFTVIVLASSKTITGRSYLYPLIPFNWSKLKSLIFRTRLKVSK
ncbi:MAG: spore germination protein [Clostridium sp.]